MAGTGTNITLLVKMVEQQAVELYMKLLKSIWNNQSNKRGWEQKAGAALGVGGAAELRLHMTRRQGTARASRRRLRTSGSWSPRAASAASCTHTLIKPAS